MKMYDSYKDSGVEWIDQIPSDWAVLKNKYFTKAAKEPSQTGEEDLLSVSEYSGVVPRKTIRIGEDHITRSDSLVGYLVVKKGQLVSNIMLMWKRGLGVSDFNGIVSPAYSVFDFTQGNPRYFHYLYRTDMYISEFRRNSTGVIESRLRLYDDSFGAIHSHFPPIETQNEIVHFLNAKTSLIDYLIEKTQRKIELLKEKRTSLINEAVTKGLNPNAEMKDSGVEWIGQIPSHWDISKLKNLGNRKTELIRVEDFNEIDVIHYSIPNVQKFGKGVKEFGGDIDSSKLLFRGGELIISKLNPRKSCVSIVESFEKEVIVGSGEFVVLYPTISNKKYLYYFLKTQPFTDYLDSSVESVTRSHQRVNPNIIYNSYVPSPPLIEQKKIVEFLDEQIHRIDNSVSNEEERIKLLKEYCQSLISSVVTGKIKVTEDA